MKVQSSHHPSGNRRYRTTVCPSYLTLGTLDVMIFWFKTWLEQMITTISQGSMRILLSVNNPRKQGSF